MLFLASFDVIKPDPGLIFWTSLVFVVLWFLVGKAAFKPIVQALRNREDSIQEALDSAAKAKSELSALQSENEKLLAQAREERTKLLAEAKEMSDRLVRDAKEKAKVEASKITAQALQEIEASKNTALQEVKNQVAEFSLSIAEQLLRKELNNPTAQKELVNDMIKDIKLN
jgi:F-type H+-transporting ATPase subunit b